MELGTCLICKSSSKLKELSTVTRGLQGIISASEIRKDGLDLEIQNMQENGEPIRVHKNCR